jgi:aspartyl-tRNA synthetase
MILTGAKSIRDVILFPLMKPLPKQESADQEKEDEETPKKE